MQVEKMINTLDLIKLSSMDIEHQIISFPLTFAQDRRSDVEWGMRFPMFVPPFYSYILNKSKVPCQNEYWLNYVEENRPYLVSMQLSVEQKKGLRARVYRTYPSLVRDLHMGITMKSCSDFDNVIYNEALDIEYGIDLVVIKNNTILGLNLFTKTKNALYAREVKEFRPKKQVGFKCVEIPIAFKGSKTCGDFFLYSEREIETIKGVILSNV